MERSTPMYRRARPTRPGRQGFTLVEIAVAVSVIGVILCIAIPQYSKVRQESRVKQAQQDVEILSAAVLQLAWDTGKWPGGIPRNVLGNPEVWDLTTASAGLLSANSLFPRWKGPYLPRIDRDPWGSAYFFDPDYTTPDGQVHAVVGSFGPNRSGRNLYDSDNVFVVLD